MPEIEEEAPRQSCLTSGRQELADSMMKSVKASVSKLRHGDPPTIYIVPRTIRQEKEVAYEPQFVSIGPYHHGKKSLQGIEEKKWLYLHSFLSRNPNHPLEDYLKVMEELEDEAGSCYSDNIGRRVGNEFVKMMVLDACFIVEIFLRLHPVLLRKQWKELKQNEEDLGLLSAMEKFFFHSNGFQDPILNMVGMVNDIVYDMLLLENQIPFFVLQRIFIMACPVNVPHLLEKMALNFLDRFMPTNKEIEIKDSYYHLLHLFHSHLKPTLTDSEKPNLSCNPTIKYVLDKLKNLLNLSCNPTIKYVLDMLKNLLIFLQCSKETSLPITELREMIPCATDLRLAGVKFKKNKKSNNILNVKFSHGVLEITPFQIHYHREILFRNLVAFEECHPEANAYFTTYFMLMSFLVKTSKDVELLHHKGIIDNYYRGSDDDLANLLHRLCTGTSHSFKKSYLSDLHENLQKHCEKRCNIWWASLKREYFSNPWSPISLIVASILLLLTITQTFFNIFHYFRPRS